ncbi:hypothetical protein DLAC_11756 [Tieghemostelium lacteum]|uniref:Transmembrane protein n=1 Tax=Tieghemostelium lacteum TaxID=361077 RepID=A0A151Z913_TIELA|nr:hypothetical protein DLAC_11756 [Tieghemostelium lacteum]|eukprot:KYQ90441.1 hypothetical protein DLAC_11756 [Tieghemostelium lacteum]
MKNIILGLIVIVTLSAVSADFVNLLTYPSCGSQYSNVYGVPSNICLGQYIGICDYENEQVIFMNYYDQQCTKFNNNQTIPFNQCTNILGDQFNCSATPLQPANSLSIKSYSSCSQTDTVVQYELYPLNICSGKYGMWANYTCNSTYVSEAQYDYVYPTATSSYSATSSASSSGSSGNSAGSSTSGGFTIEKQPESKQQTDAQILQYYRFYSKLRLLPCGPASASATATATAGSTTDSSQSGSQTGGSSSNADIVPTCTADLYVGTVYIQQDTCIKPPANSLNQQVQYYVCQ